MILARGHDPTAVNVNCVSRPWVLTNDSDNNVEFEDPLIYFLFGDYMEQSERRTESMTSLTKPNC